MNEGLIPRRYAKALLEFAKERNSDQRLYGLMDNLTHSFAANPDLEVIMANPFVAPDRKEQLLMTAAGAGSDDVAYADFLKLLRGNKRLPMARSIAIAYGEGYRKEHNIYRVEVTAAAPMAPADEERLKKFISSHLDGGTMEYSFKVKPELIGGFTVSVGSEKLDASVQNDLKQLQLKLLG